MSETLDAAKAFLEKDEMKFEEREEMLFLPLCDSAGKWSACLYDLGHSFVCSAVFPVNVPENRRDAMALLLARLNWRLINGSWELDFADGEVRFKTSAPVRNCALTPEQARDLCYINFNTFTKGWSALLAVISGAKPEKAAELALPKPAPKKRSRRKPKSAPPTAEQRKEFNDVMQKLGFTPEEIEGEKKGETPPPAGPDPEQSKQD